jgi:hypothetical protein
LPALFDPERHEPLSPEPWQSGAALAAIEAIVADVRRAGRDGAWPAHPLDQGVKDGSRALYMGAAGILWGLVHLARQGAIASDPHWVEWALALPEAYRATPDTSRGVPSYFVGEAGILLTALRAQPSAALADRLFEVVKSNVHNPTLEMMWGAPGSALAAVFAHELTGDDRWRVVYLDSLQALEHSWREHDGDACALWTQDLYGRQRRILGAAHGFAGNVFSILRGRSLSSEVAFGAAVSRAVGALRATVELDGERANWPSDTGRERFYVQWCHGAPGVLTSFARAPADPELDALWLPAAELIWQAGPLKKGSNLCHGTAGNGAALLATFVRTGDERWLDRARRFGMHAIAQVAAARDEYGRGRYSLWLGDIGVAVYLWHCVHGMSGLPSLDF